ncbi:cholesterol 7-desaturase nvd-like [Halichondria panicea]|uniref:cholesterol 7-desaturase nvd-like n=1 Tax=Halichondria panicea TaxID=6063 RepID=UPI00312B8E7B
MTPSISLLIHIAGLIAVSQFIFSGNYEQQINDSLNGNVTGTLERVLDTVSSALPFSSDVVSVGWLLRMLLYSAATVYILYIGRNLYQAIFGVVELYCPETKAGFDFPSRKMKGFVTKRDFVNEVQKRRKMGDIPPPFPNGWFGLLRSTELKAGQSTAVNALGQNFAVFRDDKGNAHVLDAYCAHLGANLGVGGKIYGSCVQCPFHGWQFDGETGQCTKIPYAKGKIPAQAKVKAWPTLECNGAILVWHDAEGREPLWSLKDLEGIGSRFVYRLSSTHFIKTHIQDIAENGADVAHLTYLHGAGVSSGAGMDYRELLSGKLHTHSWTARWESLPKPSTYVGRMTLTMTNSILGVNFKSLDITSIADQMGCGVVYLTLKSKFGTVLLLHTVTPLEPFLQKYSVVAYSDWWIPTFLVKWLVQAYDVQLERDMIVWNNKRYSLKPLLVREDELILKHRRWYSQFYSKNSNKFTFIKDELDF